VIIDLKPKPILQAKQGQPLWIGGIGGLRQKHHQVERVEILRQGELGREAAQPLLGVA
jgi:hypothetical protein